jgi:hypothetical protein
MDCPSASEGAFARVRFDCLIFVGPAKMKLQRANYRPNELIRLASVGRPLRFGDRCRLISGGRDLLVVDVGPDPDFDLGSDDLMVASRTLVTPRLRDPATSSATWCRCSKDRQSLGHAS